MTGHLSLCDESYDVTACMPQVSYRLCYLFSFYHVINFLDNDDNDDDDVFW